MYLCLKLQKGNPFHDLFWLVLALLSFSFSLLSLLKILHCCYQLSWEKVESRKKTQTKWLHLKRDIEIWKKYNLRFTISAIKAQTNSSRKQTLPLVLHNMVTYRHLFQQQGALQRRRATRIHSKQEAPHQASLLRRHTTWTHTLNRFNRLLVQVLLGAS